VNCLQAPVEDPGTQPLRAGRGSNLVFRIDATVPLDATIREQIADALESNRIVLFEPSPVPLPEESMLQSLRRELPARLRLKNISYYPERQRLLGLEGNGELRQKTATVLREHLESVRQFLPKVLPHLCVDWTVGKSSFRPLQERGRNLRAHASNELVHIDAGAYGATHGDRILRFFVNVNEREDRVWASKGPIQDVLARHGRGADLFDETGRLTRRIRKNAADHALSVAVRALTMLNPAARALDSSPYDRAMRRLHNYMKDSDAFRQDMRGYEEMRFPPGSAWMVFTDGLSHACLEGQFALATTILVRRSALRHPELAPYSLLAARGQRLGKPVG
jgi:3-deoxy-D-manno-oct-2-ulosonic acid (Kdo) hydroxylase